MRIAVGGFQHETNTFAAHPATLADFIAEARAARHDLVPLTWCSATPSGRVTRDAYEHISALLLDDLRAHRNIDAVYLDLHGAMVAEHIDDADGCFGICARNRRSSPCSR